MLESVHRLSSLSTQVQTAKRKVNEPKSTSAEAGTGRNELCFSATKLKRPLKTVPGSTSFLFSAHKSNLITSTQSCLRAEPKQRVSKWSVNEYEVYL